MHGKGFSSEISYLGHHLHLVIFQHANHRTSGGIFGLYELSTVDTFGGEKKDECQKESAVGNGAKVTRVIMRDLMDREWREMAIMVGIQVDKQ